MSFSSLNLKKRDLAKYLIRLSLFIIFSWLIYKAIRFYQIKNALENNLYQVELLLEKPDQIDGVQLNALLEDSRQQVVNLQKEAAPFLPLSPYLGWFPKAGPLIYNAPYLLEMGDIGSSLAMELVPPLLPAVDIVQDKRPMSDKLPDLLLLLQQNKDQFEQLPTALNQLQENRAQLKDVEKLPGQIQTALFLFDNYADLAAQFAPLIPYLPTITGIDQPQTYLILAQNEDELRATGGFISGVGILKLDNGRINSLEFIDANIIDDYLNKPYAFPPEPLYQFMGIELFTFRDSNYWPDFPSSAEKVIELFQYGQPNAPEIDGVIALNQRFLELMLQATGPIYIEELDRTISSNNFYKQLRISWNDRSNREGVADWVANRKSFIGPMAGAIQTKFETDFKSIDVKKLIKIGDQTLREKEIQFYFRQPEIGSIFAQNRWDGRLINWYGQDYLYFVDTNVGYNKVSRLIETELFYQVDLTKLEADLQVQQKHLGPNSAPNCVQGFDYRDIRYEEMEDSCHWSYMRIYTAEGSKLTNSSMHSYPATAFTSQQPYNRQAIQLDDDPAPLALFDHFSLLRRAQTAETNFTYQLPTTILVEENGMIRYTLFIPKQSGLSSLNLEATIQLPANTDFIAASDSEVEVVADTIIWKKTITEDQYLTIWFSN